MGEPVNPGIRAESQDARWTTDDDGHPLWVALRPDGGVEVIYAHPDSDHLTVWTHCVAAGVPYVLGPSNPVSLRVHRG